MLRENPSRETGREYAMRVIKDKIVHLELEPGAMVSENELAQELGLSRTPVREALMELARVKIIEVAPQRGSRIALIDYKMVDEAGFVRRTLECAVAERCCECITEDDLRELYENIKMQHFFLENGMEDRLLAADNELHRCLFRIADVMQTYRMMMSMMIHMDRVRMMSIRTHSAAISTQEHETIVHAIENRDPEAARQAMWQHLTRYKIDKDAVCALYPQYVKQA